MRLPFVKRTLDRTFLILCPVEQCEPMMNLLELAFSSGKRTDPRRLVLRNAQTEITFTCLSCAGWDEQERQTAAWIRKLVVRYGKVQSPGPRAQALLDRLYSCGGVVRMDASCVGRDLPRMSESVTGVACECARAVRGLVTDLSGSVYDENFRLLLDWNGAADPQATLPPMDLCPQPVWNETPAELLLRKKRSMEILRARQLPVNEELPVIWPGSARTVEAVCRRAVALLVVALYSECRLDEEDPLDHEQARAYVQPILETYQAEDFFSPKEWAYLENPASSRMEQIQFAWQYENVWVMEWALGLTDELPWPDRICDVPRAAGIMREHYGMEQLMQAARLRPQSELLDAADLIDRLHWYCNQARLQGTAPQSLDAGVVMERHRGLFWVAGCDGAVEWDDVNLST